MNHIWVQLRRYTTQCRTFKIISLKIICLYDRTCRCCTSDLGTSEHCSRGTLPGMGLASTLSAWEHQGVRRRQGWWGRVSWALLWSPGHSLDHCSWVVSGDEHLPVCVHCRLGVEILPDHRDYEHWETCCRRYQSWTLPCWGASGSLSYTSTPQTEILLWRWGDRILTLSKSLTWHEKHEEDWKSSSRPT